MLTAPRSSFTPARPLKGSFSEPRLLGFLNANRRILVLGAIASCGLLTSIPSLPAQADALFGTADVSIPLQSYTAPAGLEVPVERDAFAISSYSVVQWPVPASTPISSGFDYRECDGCATDHKGTDFNPGSGYPIEVISDGVVTSAGWDSTGYGYMVIVQHVIDGQDVQSLYAHLLDGSITVTVGQEVKRGEVLGLVGSTGQSTGAHLHLGILLDGTFVDPLPWMQAHVNV